MVTSERKKWDMARGCLSFIGVFISVILAMGIYALVTSWYGFDLGERVGSVIFLVIMSFAVFVLFSQAMKYHRKIAADRNA